MLLWISGMLLLLQSRSRRRGQGMGSSSKASSSSSEFSALWIDILSRRVLTARILQMSDGLHNSTFDNSQVNA